MASNNTDPSTGSSDRISEDPSANARDRTLLQALQNFIVPLIRAVDQTRQDDTNQMPLGPEAGKLITALQEFIATIVGHSQLKTKSEILVESGFVVEGQNEPDRNRDTVGEGSSEVGMALPEPSNRGAVGDNNSENQVALEQAEPTFNDKVLIALREHVFNMMPIRLLCFQPHGPGLKIALLERGAIYARLTSAMEADIQDPKSRWRRAKTEEGAVAQLISKHTGYAILSHTWLRTSREVTYSDWQDGRFDANDPGYRKLVNFCKTAWKTHGVAFGWMDTVCINKDSSSELDESIRSMFNWYSRADVCITYLAETTTIPNMHKDPWFTRGWTLQELLAPEVVKFYNNDWKRFIDHSDNDKKDRMIMEQIKRATTISSDELNYIFGSPISRRMQLAAAREVTREEDQAYSLMGIFKVNFSTAYGEGAERAFFRLLQEILVSSTYSVLDIFNWAGELPPSRPHTSRILPSSPIYYLRRSSIEGLELGRPMEPLILTHLGLRVPVILLPAISQRGTESIGNYTATVDISPVGYYRNYLPTTYDILDKRISGPDGRRAEHRWNQLTFAVFNVHADSTRIHIPKICSALALQCFQDAGKVSALGAIQTIETDAPIVFELRTRSMSFDNNPNGDNDLHYQLSYGIKPERLLTHGMQLVSLYL